MGDIHVLPASVTFLSAVGLRQNVGISGREPGRNRIGRRANDHLNAVFFGCFQHTVQMGKIEYIVLGLPCAPGGFRDADDVDVRLFHHFHVRFDSVVRQIFVIISCPK